MSTMLNKTFNDELVRYLNVELGILDSRHPQDEDLSLKMAVTAIKSILPIIESRDPSDSISEKGMYSDISEAFCYLSNNRPEGILSNFIDMVTRAMVMYPLTPLTGDDDEWEEYPLDKPLYIKYLSSSLEVTSIQINKRYRLIYRFNKDNQLAHRVDAWSLYEFGENDDIRPMDYHSMAELGIDGVRFIEFPYDVQKPRTALVCKFGAPDGDGPIRIFDMLNTSVDEDGRERSSEILDDEFWEGRYPTFIEEQGTIDILDEELDDDEDGGSLDDAFKRINSDLFSSEEEVNEEEIDEADEEVRQIINNMFKEPIEETSVE